MMLTCCVFPNTTERVCVSVCVVPELFITKPLWEWSFFYHQFFNLVVLVARLPDADLMVLDSGQPRT